jgi:serine phosphatase RsbU (regulator of sigma subunit)
MRIVFPIFLFILQLFPVGIFAQVNFEKEVSKFQENALCYINRNDLSNASLCIDSAINLLPGVSSVELRGSVNITSASIFAKREQYQQAINRYLIAANYYHKLNDSLTLTDIYNQVARLYLTLEAYGKSLEYFDNYQQIAPSSIVDFDFNLKLNELKANCFFNLKQFDKAEILYKNLYATYAAYFYNEKSIAALNNITITLEKQRKYEEAIYYHRVLYGIYPDFNRKHKLAEVLNNIGYNFVMLRNYPEAQKAFLNAEKELNKGTYTDDFKANLFTNIGICYQNTGDYTNALDYLIRARKIREQSDNFEELATINNIIAVSYFKNDDLYNALEYCIDATAAANKTINPNLKTLCYNTYSQVLQEAEEHQKALDYYKRFLSLQDSLLRVEREKHEKLDKLIFELEKNEKEYKLKMVEESVKDILLEQLELKAKQREHENEILKKERELEKSEKERVEQSLALVQQQNQTLLQKKEIEALEIERNAKENQLRLKEAQEKEQAKAIELLQTESEKQSLVLEKQQLSLEKQAEKEKRFIWMMSLAVVIIILIIIFLVFTKKQNKTLSLQKQEIVEKNEELTSQKEELKTVADHLTQANNLLTENNIKIEQQSFHIISSIQYAKRIQDALLPQDESIAEFFPHNFVLLRPRDIVSGDFYWVKQIQNVIYVAVSDCTGHGVPGAFMSMLGIAFLNEITGQGEIYSPAVILNGLRERVIMSLKQVGKSGEAKDGMDMVLIMINKDTDELTFAGAYNSLLHIRSNGSPDDQIVTRLKGDKMPIGISFKNNSFTNQTLELKPDDMLYLYTDGFIDQIGGETKTKYMTKNLAYFLQEIHSKDTTEQKILLEKNLDDWIAGYNQLDDILLLGIRHKYV